MIVAVVALVAALGGTAVAGSGNDASTSVSKKQTKKIAKQQAKKQVNKKLPIEEKNLADGAVTTAKIGDNQVTGAKVDESSLNISTSCPAGTTPNVGACIESSPRAAANLQPAVDTCGADERRLPSAVELINYTRNVTAIPATEMSGDFIGTSANIDVNISGSRSSGNTADATPYRCVTPRVP